MMNSTTVAAATANGHADELGALLPPAYDGRPG